MIGSGREALDTYIELKDRIDLIVLDLIMPHMGGNECMGEILKLDPSARILIASGYAANGQLDEALIKGARAVIRKPYEAKQMLEMVRRLLDEE